MKFNKKKATSRRSRRENTIHIHVYVASIGTGVRKTTGRAGTTREPCQACMKWWDTYASDGMKPDDIAATSAREAMTASALDGGEGSTTKEKP